MVLLAVNGTLMRGLELCENMADAGATFVEEARTQPLYRLWSINNRHPAMLRVSDGSGASVALELWEVPPAGLALILQREPPGLSIGCVLLSDTRVLLGVLGEPFLVESQREITAFGGWRAYTASLSSSLSAPPTLGCVTLPAACPYPFSFPLKSTALIMVDMQLDFCSSGGFGAALGNDVSQLRGCIPSAVALLTAARASKLLVVHTLESHAPDLSDCPSSKRTRGQPKEGLRIGDVADTAMGRILIRGEPGNGLLPELAPLEGELVIHKPGKGAFYATGLGSELSKRRITHLLFAGVTTEVCVASTMREANDRGFECCLVSDATASYFPEFKAQTLAMITAQGGIVGWTAAVAEVTAALS